MGAPTENTRQLSLLRDQNYPTFVATIDDAVSRTGNVRAAAALLEIPERTMWRFMKDAKLASPKRAGR